MWLSETSQRQKGKHFPFSLFVMSSPGERVRTKQEVSLAWDTSKAQGKSENRWCQCVGDREPCASPVLQWVPEDPCSQELGALSGAVKDKASGITS